jgi:hypothetical protein
LWPNTCDCSLAGRTDHGIIRSSNDTEQLCVTRRLNLDSAINNNYYCI